MKHAKRTNILLRATGCCLLAACWACSAEMPLGLAAEEGTPVEIVAEIQDVQQTKAVADYDRTSSFIANDKVRVYRLVNESRVQQADYTCSGSGSAWTLSSSDPVTLQAASEYEAVFPSDYTGIRQDQSAADGSGYLKSNYLKSGKITSRDGILRFTDAGAFVHQNVKLTLEFKVQSGGGTDNKPAVDFTNALLSAPGLLNGGSDDENITLYRPDASAYLWCGIVYPKNANTTLNLQLTYQGVVYKAAVSCALAAGTHYRYTLTLKNNILVPEGGTIEGWKTDSTGDYTGEFDKEVS